MQFPAKQDDDSVGFLVDFPFGEVDDAVTGRFKGEVGTAFIEVSVGATRAIDLNGEPLKGQAAKTLPLTTASEICPTQAGSKSEALHHTQLLEL